MPAAEADVPSGVNPPIADQCGLDVTLVLDASGSVNSARAVGDVRAAGKAFIDTLADTDSRARITQFATLSEELAPRTEITAASVRAGGVLGDAIIDYYPGSPRPVGTDLYRYDGRGDALSARNYDDYNRNSSATIWTNWDQGLDAAGSDLTPGELVVFITDGRPTAFDFSEATDPFDQGPPPDVAVANNGNPSGRFAEQALDRAVLEANEIKASGARILTVGVGSALDSTADQDRLVAISGDKVVRDADLAAVDGINDIDVALVQDFDDLANALRTILLQLCSPSLTITKLAQSPMDGSYLPAGGWDITVTPAVNPPGTSFRWILPDDTAATSKTVATQPNGTAQFQWEPEPPESDTRAVIREAVEPGYDPGRPDTADYRCEARNERGDTRTVSGELDGDEAFELDPIGQEIVTCTIWNSFEYASAIDLEKVNSPTQVRGDLEPAATVTSTFRVTNAGNSALTNITLVDDRCSGVTYVAGDTGDDGVLPPGELADGAANPLAEEWTYTCERTAIAPVSDASDRIVNTATVAGNDPVGTHVTAVATDDVDVHTAGVEIDKTANPTQVARGEPATITYTYDVSNPGSLQLENVAVVDDPDVGPAYNAGCAPIDFDTGDTDRDRRLDPAETWTFTCESSVADPQVTLVNLARVTGDPVFPDLTPAPPLVTDDDPAVVTLFDGQIDLAKTVGTDPGSCAGVDEITVLEGAAVTYCYTVTNPGDTDLRSPDQSPGGYTPEGWVIDDRGPTGTCGPVDYESGDVNGDGLLQPSEAWVYLCDATASVDAVNTATVTAETATATPIAVTASDRASVNVVRPEIAVEKNVLRPVVLDPAAAAVDGPDVPTPRPAEFTFDVTNTGDLPLGDVVVTDTYPQDRSKSCTPAAEEVAGVNAGDVDGDGLLDPGEDWRYRCVHDGSGAEVLTKDDADVASDPVLPAPITDHARASATVLLDGVPSSSVESGEVERQVLVIAPGIALTKRPSSEVVLLGDEVTYTLEVANTGDVALANVVPSDDKCSPLAYQSGDDGDTLLQPTETWVYTCTRPINSLGPDTNVASVVANGPLGNRYRAEAAADVRAIDPAIELVKTVSEDLVPAGTEVTYEFVATNAGGNPVLAADVLAEVTLVDVASPAQSACESPAFVGGDAANPGFLDRGESWTYTCVASIDFPTSNVAGVRAVGGVGPDFDPDLPVPVFAFDYAFVQPFTPALDVDKTASPDAVVGEGEVTYTYEVRNTGDVPLADVAERITDDTCSPVSYVGGDVDEDGLLDTPESMFEDASDEVWSFSCTTVVDETTTNTVVAPGTPTDPGGTPLCGPDADAGRVTEPCDVTTTDTATVTVVAPGQIVVQKETIPDGSTESFTFATDFDVAHDDLVLADGQSFASVDLAPGVYRVSEAVPDGWRVPDVACEGDGGSTAMLAGDEVVIDLVAGDVVICTFTNTREVTGTVDAGVDPPDPQVGPETPGGRLPALGVGVLGLLLAAGTSLLLGVGLRRAGARS